MRRVFWALHSWRRSSSSKMASSWTSSLSRRLSMAEAAWNPNLGGMNDCFLADMMYQIPPEHVAGSGLGVRAEEKRWRSLSSTTRSCLSRLYALYPITQLRPQKKSALQPIFCLESGASAESRVRPNVRVNVEKTRVYSLSSYHVLPPHPGCSQASTLRPMPVDQRRVVVHGRRQVSRPRPRPTHQSVLAQERRPRSTTHVRSVHPVIRPF